jgi:NADPH:quinone reductase-like Zn-dependent oxidoreductase/pimeloyl-ACP methyl ester carboxylesterase
MKKSYVDLPAGQIHLRRVDGPGLPIVFLHRTPNSSASFDAVLARLAGRRGGIAFDTPGFGASFTPPGRTTTIDYANWFLAALDALRVDAFHVCGHHSGTHFAMEMARIAPGRVRSLLLSGVMYADAGTRAFLRTVIPKAPAPDTDGRYVDETWKLMRGLFTDWHPDVVHSDFVGALAHPTGRDQAFDAILSQDVPSILRQVRCPVAIAQAVDDSLATMLPRLQVERPDIPVERLGLAGMAAPELQPDAFAAAALRLATAHDTPSTPGPAMTDRRFQLVRTPTGFDLEQVKIAPPNPGPGEVLVRVRTVSINRRDLSIRSFEYPVGEADRFVPLSDGAGDVVAVGAGVNSVKVGDRVTGTFFQDWEDGRIGLPALFSSLGGGGRGMAADHVVLSEKGVVKIHGGWTYEEAACLPCAATTAWSGLMRFGQLQKGDSVLIVGTGGVAIFALQIAVAAGAKVAIVSSSDAKLARAKELGATVTVNYAKTPEWGAAVKEATGGGVQHAIELGGKGTLPQSLAALGVGGHVAMIGALAGFGGEIPGFAMVMGALRVSAIVVGPRAAHVECADFLANHGLKPVVDSVYAFDDMDEAYARTHEGAFGKVVVKLD